MDNINAISDEELWHRASSGDIEAEESLVEKYASLVRVCARPYFLAGGDSEDLIQEGMVGLLAAIRRFEPGHDASFKTYAELCIRTRLYTAIRSASRFKHSPLNESISFESPQFDEKRTSSFCCLRDPEELVIIRELTDEIFETLSGSLSKLEKEILGYYLDGISYSDIAVRIEKPVKSVDNAVQRIRKKLAQSLKLGEISLS